MEFYIYCNKHNYIKNVNKVKFTRLCMQKKIGKDFHEIKQVLYSSLCSKCICTLSQVVNCTYLTSLLNFLSLKLI